MYPYSESDVVPVFRRWPHRSAEHCRWPACLV